MTHLRDKFLEFFEKLKSIRTIYFIILYLITKLILIVFIIRPYNYNPWSLVGIWEGFAQLNPGYVEKGSVIFQNGGYDGQFFYLITKYLSGTNLSTPVLDAFHLRFHRIGLSLAIFPFVKIFGFHYYPLLLAILLTMTHIAGFYFLRTLCETGKKHYALFHLFSPFSLNSDLLLVADAFMVSFLLFALLLLHRSGAFSDTKTVDLPSLAFSTMAFTFSIFIKEGALFMLLPFCAYFLLKRKWLICCLFVFPLLTYFLFTRYAATIQGVNLGTNPLSFSQLIDYPFWGLVKSFDVPADFKGLVRELVKIPLLAYFVFLISLSGKIKSLRDGILYTPILFTILQVTIAEEGYWRSFDNLSRMFAMSLPYSIFLYSSEDDFRFKGVVSTGLFISLLLVLRIVAIKSQMLYWIHF